LNKEKVKSNVCQIEYCDRTTHKESKYCIFHAKPEEKTEEEFKKAIKKYIQEIEEEDKDHDFIDFIFIGDINFKEDLDISIFKNTRFWRAIFEGEAHFEEAIFEGLIHFENATFQGRYFFYRCNL